MAVNTKTVSGFAALVLALAAPVVAYFEGYVPTTYADPIGIPTICYGHTGADVVAGRVASRAECETLLHGDLAIAFAAVIVAALLREVGAKSVSITTMRG